MICQIQGGSYNSRNGIDQDVRIARHFVKSMKKLQKSGTYRTRAIITRGLYTFYPLFEVHLCTVTFGLMYG